MSGTPEQWMRQKGYMKYGMGSYEKWVRKYTDPTGTNFLLRIRVATEKERMLYGNAFFAGKAKLEDETKPATGFVAFFDDSPEKLDEMMILDCNAFGRAE